MDRADEPQAPAEQRRSLLIEDSHEEVAAAPPPAPRAEKKADQRASGGTAAAKRPQQSAAKPVRTIPLSAPAATVAAPLAPVASAPPAPTTADANTEAYSHVVDNPFVSPKSAPLSTFSIDVDTAAYANVRRFLREGAMPPADAVRIEELVNYFSYAYPEPSGDAPFSVTRELSQAPWNPKHRLLLVGLQGKRLAPEALPPRNLVFLVDVSGSMNEPNKLPLLKYSLAELVKTLSPKDRVSLVVYAGASGVVLQPTSGRERSAISQAIERLEAGGSTNGAAGIEAAYALAERNFDPQGVNRVILATDGDFNVGVSSEGELVRLIEKKREKGVYLTVLGFGMGNYKDSNLEQLADHGNGNYAYIDSRAEARKVLVDQGGSTLVTIAKDVKIQVEFNPSEVAAYRLIGYENRALRAQDFNDDRKDAGEIGPGHSVTALYELIAPGDPIPGGKVDPLKYQRTAPANGGSDEVATVKLRFKRPRSESSELLSVTVPNRVNPIAQVSPDFRFASAVASFGMLLRGSEYKGSSSYPMVRSLAESSGPSPNATRAEFIGLIARAEELSKSSVLAPKR
ncbi:MAG TPA: VWA domain-containing protein [Polyangiaceae bacterium]|nr:VWA domain-containing protein [Polyangiaceae bacterium]